MFALNIVLSERPTAAQWDLISGILYQFHTQGINEGEALGPNDETSLQAGPIPENEFEHALEPGVLEPPLAFSAYFLNRRDIERAQRALAPVLDPMKPNFQILEEEEKDYSSLFRENFKPIELDHFLVRASWHDLKPRKGQLELVIEPGMAFGTGAHFTTKSCLEAIYSFTSARKKTELSKCTALDFGCGSGILGIAIKKLGVGSVTAVDIDPLALDATRANAKTNGVKVNVSSHVSQLKDLDLIAANLLKITLLEFAAHFRVWLKSGGTLILSGLLKDQESDVLAAYQAQGFTLARNVRSSPADENEEWTWTTLVLTKN